MVLAHIRKLAGPHGSASFDRHGFAEAQTCAVSNACALCSPIGRNGLSAGVRMVPQDDGDCLSIEITGDRLVVWTEAGMQQVAMPDPQRSMAEVFGSLIRPHRLVDRFTTDGAPPA